MLLGAGRKAVEQLEIGQCLGLAGQLRATSAPPLSSTVENDSGWGKPAITPRQLLRRYKTRRAMPKLTKGNYDAASR